jgi:DNA-binding transcriptional LysR family regulator
MALGLHSLDPEGSHVDPIVCGASALLKGYRELADPHRPGDRCHAWQCAVGEQVRVSVHVDGPFVLNDMRLLIDAALHGAGLAIVMEDMVAPFIADGRLVRVLEDWSPPISGYHLYYPNRRHPSPAFAALLEELRANVYP